MSKITTIRIDQNLHDKVSEIANKDGRSFNYIVVKALEAIVSDQVSPVKSDKVPYQAIVDLYHEILPELPAVRELTAKRKSQIGARWKSGQLPDVDTWRRYFEYVRKSNFLMGKTDPINGHKRFVANLEWLTNESNYAKVYEKKYHGKI